MKKEAKLKKRGNESVIDVESLAIALREEQHRRTVVCEPYTGKPLVEHVAWDDATHVLRDGWRAQAKELIANYDRIARERRGRGPTP